MRIKINEDVARDVTLMRDVIYCVYAHAQKHAVDTSSTIKLMNLIHPSLQEMAKRLITASANRNYSFCIEVNNKNNNVESFKVDELNKYLSKSSVIIMENETSDGKFLDVILKTLEEHSIISGKNDSWEIRGAGGCGEMVNAIKNECDKFVKKPRIFIIHDSDLTYPGQALDKAHLNIKKKAEEVGVKEVMLSKREVENYIPDSTISYTKTKLDMLKEFSKLSSTQKDFFDYKKGLATGSEEYRNLYSMLDEETIDKIKDGFGKNIGTNIFSSDFNFTKESFNARCEKIIPEFQDICRTIKDIL